jgi:hypothetical protein
VEVLLSKSKLWQSEGRLERLKYQPPALNKPTR